MVCVIIFAKSPFKPLGKSKLVCAIFFRICFTKPCWWARNLSIHKKWGLRSPFFIPYLYSLLLNFNFIPKFIQKGTQCVPFCIPTLRFLLCSLCFDIKRPRPFYNAFSSLKLKLVPLSPFDSTWILLPWAWTMCFTMERPSPVPPLSLVRLLSIR